MKKILFLTFVALALTFMSCGDDDYTVDEAYEKAEITNVTVSDNFEINVSSQPIIGIGATNTDFKVKAKSGLNAGNYTGTITVTDENGKTYTATVTLKVEPKELTGLGISGLDSTWVYGTTKTPTATGVVGLGVGDYKITYSKENNGSYEDIGTTLPKLVGKYKATLSVTNQNYTASNASVDFEITPITTEVKIKSYDDTFTYDGTEHTKNAYDVLWANNASPVTDNKLPNGDLVTAEITGKVKDVKDTALENNTIGKITNPRKKIKLGSKKRYAAVVSFLTNTRLRFDGFTADFKENTILSITFWLKIPSSGIPARRGFHLSFI